MTNGEAKATFLLEYCGERCDGFIGDDTCKNCEIKLALDALDRANTCGFEHFRLYADSTLKNMSKEKLIDYIHMLYHNWQATDSTLNNAINANYNLQGKFDNAIEELEEQYHYMAAEIVREWWIR